MVKTKIAIRLCARSSGRHVRIYDRGNPVCAESAATASTVFAAEAAAYPIGFSDYGKDAKAVYSSIAHRDWEVSGSFSGIELLEEASKYDSDARAVFPAISGAYPRND